MWFYQDSRQVSSTKNSHISYVKPQFWVDAFPFPPPGGFVMLVSQGGYSYHTQVFHGVSMQETSEEEVGKIVVNNWRGKGLNMA